MNLTTERIRALGVVLLRHYIAEQGYWTALMSAKLGPSISIGSLCLGGAARLVQIP
jgi:hypothetical protein